MIRIEEINTKEQFKSMENEWTALLENSPSNTIFLTFEWLYEWWNVYHENKQLKVLVVYNSDELVGIAPFFIERTTYVKFITVSEIKFLGSDDVGSDYLDIIIKEGAEEVVLKTIFEYLMGNRKYWDCLRLNSIPIKSKTIPILKRFGQKNRLFTIVKNFSKCPYVELPDTWADYMSSLSSNMRYNIKRKIKKIEKTHNVEFEYIKNKQKLVKAVDDFIYLNKRRMEVKKIEGAFRLKKFTQFHKQIIPKMFDKQLLKLFFLIVNESPIASLYIFQHNNKYLYYQAGFDPQWSQFSPGTLMFTYCIQHAINEKMNEFDFLQGEEDFKSSWAKNQKINLEIAILNRSIRSYILFVTEKMRVRLGRLKRRFIDQ